jgi:hypothetical protein
MKAFIIHTRQFPGCRACRPDDTPLTIVEVEGEYVTPMEDPSIMQLPKGEFKFRITKPVFLHEAHESKKADGSKEKILVPSVYCSHAIYLSIEEAREATKKLVVGEFEFAVRKKRIESYSEADVEGRLSEIQELKLP